ncbi:hypothetical protein Stsp02_13800 [Streptomyces sp. NBRC 14336]|nr:hypothetical protein Stsp02_13800 [Streptomyces sp. NBRC 14336]
MSHWTPASRRSSSSVTVWSVVQATAAVVIPPASHAVTPPTASTTNPAAPATRVARGRTQIRLNTPTEGSLPLSGPRR